MKRSGRHMPDFMSVLKERQIFTSLSIDCLFSETHGVLTHTLTHTHTHTNTHTHSPPLISTLSFPPCLLPSFSLGSAPPRLALSLLHFFKGVLINPGESIRPQPGLSEVGWVAVGRCVCVCVCVCVRLAAHKSQPGYYSSF